MRSLIPMFLALPVVFLGCTPSIQLNPKWSQDVVGEKKLAVILPEEKISVSYSGSVKDEFGAGDPTTLIRKNVIDLLIKRTVEKTRFKNVWSDNYSAEVPMESRACSDGIKMGVPIGGTAVTLSQGRPDYVLCFGDVSVKTSVILEMNGVVPSYSKHLYLSTRFYLWDVRQQSLVEFGYTSNQDDNGMYTDIKNWYNIIDATLKEILAKTPFFLAKDN
jgi:hypothetical protein